MAPAIMIAPKLEAGSISVPASVLHQLPAAQDLAKTLSVRSLVAGQRSGIGGLHPLGFRGRVLSGPRCAAVGKLRAREERVPPEGIFVVVLEHDPAGVREFEAGEDAGGPMSGQRQGDYGMLPDGQALDVSRTGFSREGGSCHSR